MTSAGTFSQSARRAAERFQPWLIRLAYLAGALAFFWTLSAEFERRTGFTSLLTIGDLMEQRAVKQLRDVPHWVYTDSWGYDGTYYVQLALSPALTDPELQQALDSPTYRARRIFPSWMAWVLGYGHAPWVVHAYAILNILVWVALAGLLLVWLPPVSWSNFVRWAGVVLSAGVCMSVRNALTDAPALLCVALGAWALEKRHTWGGVGALAAAALSRETSLLAGVTLLQNPERRWSWWLKLGLAGLATVLPLVLWLGYVRWRLGATADVGLNNFTLPLQGWWEKLQSIRTDWPTLRWRGYQTWNVYSFAAISVQALFFLLRWRPAELWWRLGAVYAGLLVFLAIPVWEGYPGATMRVLLPMTLAFNLAVPRGARWLPVLLAGNLSVLGGISQFGPLPRDLLNWEGDGAARAALSVRFDEGWYGVESDRAHVWRWGQQRGTMQIRSDADTATQVVLTGELHGAQPCRLTIAAGGEVRWTRDLAKGDVKVELPALLVPPHGTLALEFSSDQPAIKFTGTDQRAFAFALRDVTLRVEPAPPSPAKP